MRRFYKKAEAQHSAEGWRVVLDGKPVRAPSGAALTAGPRIIAAVAAEWEAQQETINPGAMPVTRAVNTAIDRVAPNRAAVEQDVAAYGGSDLICYRAESPPSLIEAEAAAWNPLILWAREALGAELRAVSGLTHAPQSDEALAACAAAVSAESDIGLVALHELTTLAGSLMIALAVRRGRLTAEEGWALSRIDEEHQAAQWGRDAEAEAAAAIKAQAFADAARIGALADADASSAD